LNRRKFLKNVLGTGAAISTCTLGNMFGMSAAQASHFAGTTAPTLVVIFQRGGCDGLNTVVPYGDAEYYNLRSSISIAAPSASNANAALAINDVNRGHNNFFGLNPNMSSLLPIYNAGHLAVLPTVHYPNNTHSHFSGQDFIESGIPNSINNGWLYRHLASQSRLGGLQGLSFGSDLAKSLRGNVVVQSLTLLRDFGFPSAAGDIMTRLRQNVLPLYNTPATANPARLVNNTGKIMFNNIDTLSQIDTINYQPANGAAYPVTAYGQRLKETAQLIKNDVGVRVVTIDLNGFDTHSNQGGAEPTGSHSRRVKEFSDGIAALYTDLGVRMDSVIILTMTEFGRTAKVNASNGTDHGDAASWFMVGKNIKGGIHGRWPGLGQTQLRRGRYLQYTVDYRNVFGDILVKHLGHTTANIASLIPSHTYSPVGLFI